MLNGGQERFLNKANEVLHAGVWTTRLSGRGRPDARRGGPSRVSIRLQSHSLQRRNLESAIEHVVDLRWAPTESFVTESSERSSTSSGTEVGRLALCHRRANGIGKLIIRTIPRATLACSWRSTPALIERNVSRKSKQLDGTSSSSRMQ
jgi:hypothetical protein